MRGQQFALKIRLPGWAKGNPGAGSLYKFMDATPDNFAALRVNGQKQALRLEEGYLIVERSWKTRRCGRARSGHAHPQGRLRGMK